MEKKDIFRKVGLIMGELNEQYQYLSEKPENVNDLELELFLANSNFLTDHIEILRKMNGHRTSPIPVEDNQPAENLTPENKLDHNNPEPREDKIEELTEQSEQPAVKQDSQVEEVAPETENIEEEVTNKATQNNGKIVTDEETEIRENSNREQPQEVIELPVEEITKEVVIPEKTISVETPVEEEPVPKPTINELISASQANSSTVAKQFTNHPVGDLKTIISLNDKLLFIKDLFNGYSLAYSEAIELLNRFDSLESADNFLKANYASKNNWNEKQPTVDKLYEILNRRFVK